MWGPAWIEIHWNNIWLRNRSHTTSHYTWGSVTTLHDFGDVLVRPLDTFFWAPTFSWSWLLARVCGPELQSGCQLCKVLQFVIEEIPLQHQLRKYGHSHCVSTAKLPTPMCRCGTNGKMIWFTATVTCWLFFIQVKNVGVIWFNFFMFSSFYRLHSHHKTSCCTNESTMKHVQKSDWISDLPLFSIRLLEMHVCWFLD